jgi:hypothetical protein
MDDSQIPVQDTASDPEDPEYYEKCISDFEDQHENYCESLLTRYLNTPAAMDIDALADEYFGPDPARKRGNDHG